MTTPSTSSKKPAKSILKKYNESSEAQLKETSFDEMNILATYHPSDKDYGHMNIDEPKTPYSHANYSDVESIDPEDVRRRLANMIDPKVFEENPDRDRSDDDDDEDVLTPESQERKRRFNEARKKHYNMKAEIQKSKQLLAKEVEELEHD